VVCAPYRTCRLFYCVYVFSFVTKEISSANKFIRACKEKDDLCLLNSTGTEKDPLLADLHIDVPSCCEGTNSINNVMSHRQKPVDLCPPPRLLFRGHWLQTALLPKLGSGKNRRNKGQQVLRNRGSVREEMILPARLVMALERARAEDESLPVPDMSSPRSSLENLPCSFAGAGHDERSPLYPNKYI
jgi:hypothetical protein